MICFINQMTGFYMMATLAFNELSLTACLTVKLCGILCISGIWRKFSGSWEFFRKKCDDLRDSVLSVQFQTWKTFLHGCFPSFYNCKNGTKSRKASQILFRTRLSKYVCTISESHGVNVFQRDSLSFSIAFSLA